MDSSYSSQLEYTTSRNGDSVKGENWWQFIRKETEKEQVLSGISTTEKQDFKKLTMQQVALGSSENATLVSMKTEDLKISAGSVLKDGVSSLICSVDPMAVAGSSVKEKNDPHKATYLCPHCRQFFVSHFDLLEHVSMCHVLPLEARCRSNCCSLNCEREITSDKFNRCDKELYVKHENCGTTLKTSDDLKHLKCIQKPEISHSSDMCSAAISLSLHIQSERIAHGNDKPFLCEKYGKNLKYLSELSDQHERPYKCDVCNATFKHWAGLKNHKHVHSLDRPYMCNMCGTSFRQSSALETHKRIHTNEKPYSCDVCDSAFKQSSHLKQHKRIHTNETPYSCDVCKAAFKQSVHLKQHKRIHTNEKPYICDVCSSAFRQSEHLKQHKRIHTNETPYSCDMCSAAFKQSVHLKQHKRIHTNEKPYSCDLCSAAFKQSEHLKLHKRTHTNEKPYSCDVCSAAFKQSAHLKQHKRIHFQYKP